MNYVSENDKIVLKSEDPFVELVDKIVFARKNNGRPFVARLESVVGQELWFRTKNNTLIMDKRSEIASITKYVPKKAVV